ncbi:coniferyl aldehyde dehydrogenase [Variovorax ginsengisoli]|uniref:Aldehyde dehydrogenase n=1 Tax=Variovorax ginsengisoli TaxID=363844 RepID=A0ABT8SG32_9BURK|nr:coniferyl aldehyde dehydrogenase [Variovorax ginsengisoli]MDN8618585.1 coniferyl aldehyde dehydrogenase [Variovorax ginsengisoli]MDO1537755.1 coniferyl aldehyde dehydrogenase [Variovorax ginsengisoli]
MSAVLTPISLHADAAEIERMHRLFDMQRNAFAAAPYPDLAARKAKLRRLIDALRRYQNEIVAAVNDDFGVRAGAETKLVEVMGPILEARHALSHMRSWMKPRRRSTEMLFLTNSAWVEYQPKGVVGIIGTWNFPLYLTIGPLIAALAAGNRAMVKVSEFTPRTTALLRTMLSGCFAEDEVAVFGGAVEAAQAFNALPFNHLVFTGSPRVGREVMRAAADNLTPVTLELGGKSPAIVGPDADLRDAALRIAHGKAFNAGQICVAPDYALVPRGSSNEFAAAVREAFGKLYPSVGGNPEYTSIVTERHAARLRQLLDDARAKGATLLSCGDVARTGRQMALTVVTGVNDRMQLMQEEIFGPILPVLEYDRLDDAMALVRRGDRPLSLYAFGLSPAEQRRVLRETHAGGVTLNDWGWHVFQHDLPFGGIGNSGMGTYHGEEGFRELSHAKSVFKRQRWFPIGLFYPPYGNLVQRLSMRLYLGKSA